MLFPRNHFFNIAGRPVVLWLRFLVFETFCCVWQAGHAFCCVCRKFVVAELGFSRNTRCQRLSPTELGNRIGDLDPSGSVLRCGVQQDRAVLLRILKILSFCHRSWKRRKECSIQRDCQDLNFHRLSVKSCQIRAGKCTDFSQQIDRLNDRLIYSEYIDLIWSIVISELDMIFGVCLKIWFKSTKIHWFRTYFFPSEWPYNFMGMQLEIFGVPTRWYY